MCVCVCVCGIVCFPFCAGSVCMKERNNPPPCQESGCLHPPPQGGCGFVSKLQTPQTTRTFCTLWQLVPTWLKDSDIKGGLRLLPKGDQGNASEQPFPSLGAPATSKADSGQQTRPHQRPPSPGKASVIRAWLGPAPTLDQLKSGCLGTPDYSPVQSHVNALTRQNTIFLSQNS